MGLRLPSKPEWHSRSELSFSSITLVGFDLKHLQVIITCTNCPKLNRKWFWAISAFTGTSSLFLLNVNSIPVSGIIGLLVMKGTASGIVKQTQLKQIPNANHQGVHQPWHSKVGRGRQTRPSDGRGVSQDEPSPASPPTGGSIAPVVRETVPTLTDTRPDLACQSTENFTVRRANKSEVFSYSKVVRRGNEGNKTAAKESLEEKSRGSRWVSRAEAQKSKIEVETAPVINF